MFAYAKLLWQIVWIQHSLFFFFHLCCTYGTPDSLFQALVELCDKVFKQRFRKSLFFLSGLVGKECVEIKPVRNLRANKQRGGLFVWFIMLL